MDLNEIISKKKSTKPKPVKRRREEGKKSPQKGKTQTKDKEEEKEKEQLQEDDIEESNHAEKMEESKGDISFGSDLDDELLAAVEEFEKKPTQVGATYQLEKKGRDDIEKKGTSLTLNQVVGGRMDEWRQMTENASDEPKNAVTDQFISEFLKQESIRMYWIDAHEDKIHPGTIYLFGKVFWKQSWVSISVTVSDIQRTLYVVPRDSTTPDLESTVGEEMESIRKQHKIKQFATMTVFRSYCFDELGSTSSSEKNPFLKVKYPASEPQLPSNLEGKTFTKIYGTQTSFLEKFLLTKKMMGPCWLSISEFAQTPSPKSWCSVQISASKSNIKVDSDQSNPPKLVVLSLAMKTLTRNNANEIIMISGVVHKQVSVDGSTQLEKGKQSIFTMIRKVEGLVLPVDLEKNLKNARNKHVTLFQNERTLLAELNEKLIQIDPDMIIGHNFIGFDLDVLLHRMEATKNPHWSRLGRLRRTHMPKLQSGLGGMGESTWEEKTVTSGRLICDTYLVSKDLVREKNYRLSELAKNQLGVPKQDIEHDEIPGYFNDSNKLMALIRHCENDAYLTMELTFKLNAIPLTNQLTTIAGNLWSRSLTGGRAERNEYLLLHRFHNGKFIVPDKQYNQKSGGKGRKKADYKGGEVLAPKSGYYDRFVLLVDFNSLYPSIIQEYNICFTTVDRRRNEHGEWELSQPPSSDVKTGVLPEVLKSLVDRRRSVKSAMASESDPSKLKQLDIRQMALKLTANSMYGCLGFTGSRFYAKPLAELVTRKGRETLEKTKELVENDLKLDVIYGDTDSLMINTGLSDLSGAKDIGKQIKMAVNKGSKNLEIELDGIYKTILLVRKKKYAALKVEEKNGKIEYKKEVKGLESVRRDWCPLSAKMGDFVLDQILSGNPRDEVVGNIHEFLRGKGEEMREGKINLADFVITKGITKAIEDYTDTKSQPHVVVAKRMREKGKRVNTGEHVQYIIAEGDTSYISEKAFTPEEIVKLNKKIDIQWYLETQIHPPITRLCEQIAGTDSSQLASCLGLDPEKFRRSYSDSYDANAPEDSYVNLPLEDSEERYKNAERFSVECLECHSRNVFTTIYQPNCAKCTKPFNEKRTENLLRQAFFKYSSRHYDGMVVCDESTCKLRTRQVVVKLFPKCVANTCKGTCFPEFGETTLYTQLGYLKWIMRSSPTLARIVNAFIEKNDKKFVKLVQLFPQNQ
eukprot:TRINITY_DN4996_c0_g1_i2.p1 TRINITY_DN4996_c0_g1~~TRINITY_DN4996_c0_g1_i2.p1  ORF type:complete len:1200 (-),score=325.24 TRINITY_DN4996_c0_g1_i2:2633-6232(-)